MDGDGGDATQPEPQATFKTSDLSGSAIEAGTATRVELRFTDGKRRLLTISDAERLILQESGRPTDAVPARIAGWTWRSLPRVLKWGVPVLIVSLLIPAATKQWSDAQKEQDIRGTVFTTLSEHTSPTVFSARDVSEQGNPDPQATARVVRRWVLAEDSVDPLFSVYYRHTGVQTDWSLYRQAMFDYASLSCLRCVHDPAALRRSYADIATVLSQAQPIHVVPGTPSAGGLITTLEAPQCRDSAQSSCVEAFSFLGMDLLQAQYWLLTELQHTHPPGFSHGWRDMLHDAFVP